MISSISTAITAIVALFTIFITLLINNRSSREKHLSVQPWFYIQLISRMGEKAPIKVMIANEGFLNLSIQKVELILIIENRTEQLKFRYLKKDDKYSEVGKYFDIEIPWSEGLFGKPFQILVTYQNHYKETMVAYSGRLNFTDKTSQKSFLDIKSEGVFYRPFHNTFK